MAKGKSLRLDGVVLKIYIFFYDIIGEGFFKMRIIAIKGLPFLIGLTKV
jgi:hypothetical protein